MPAQVSGPGALRGHNPQRHKRTRRVLTHITITLLYVALTASVGYQIVTAARLAARLARRRAKAVTTAHKAASSSPNAHRSRASNFRRRDYRLALRAANTVPARA
jgi:hypothetical protein